MVFKKSFQSISVYAFISTHANICVGRLAGLVLGEGQQFRRGGRLLFSTVCEYRQVRFDSSTKRKMSINSHLINIE
jgi:hypothetical protein